GDSEPRQSLEGHRLGFGLVELVLPGAVLRRRGVRHPSGLAFLRLALDLARLTPGDQERSLDRVALDSPLVAQHHDAARPKLHGFARAWQLLGKGLRDVRLLESAAREQRARQPVGWRRGELGGVEAVLGLARWDGGDGRAARPGTAECL